MDVVKSGCVVALRESPAEDVCTGRARMGIGAMAEMGVKPGDAVAVVPESNEDVAAYICRAWPWPAQFCATEKVAVDCRAFFPKSCEAAFAEIPEGSVALLQKSPFYPAANLVLRIREDRKLLTKDVRKKVCNEARVRGCLRSVAVCTGCVVVLPFGRSKVLFDVLETEPETDVEDGVVVIMPTTKITFVDDAPKESETAQKKRDDSVDAKNFVGGLSKEVEELREAMTATLLGSSSASALFAQGVLLKGEPGVGKTLMVRSIARECNAKVFVINGPEIVGSYIGESEQALRTIFASALKEASFTDDAPPEKDEEEGEEDESETVVERRPVVVFIDEIDSLCPARGNDRNESASSLHESRIVAQVVALFDRIRASKHRVVVVAATNRPNAIDAALRRPGRFDVEIEVPVPGIESREDILRVCTRQMPLGSDVDFNALAMLCVGYVGADLASLCREAAMAAIRAGEETVCQEHFIRAMRVIVPSTRRSTFVDRLGKITWADIGGLEGVKQEMKEAIEWPLTNSAALRRMGVTPPRGVLLYGPPGCAKTTLVRAAANSCSASFISVSGASIYSPYLGDAEAAVRELFKRARMSTPAIVFFDEIDAIVGKRAEAGSGNDTRDRVLSTLLNEMSGIESSDGVVVVGATNRIDLIDKALMRPGRFDRCILVDLPDEAARLKIFEVHTKKMPVDRETVDLAKLASQTQGFSGADIASLCKEAAMCALREDITNRLIKECHFDEALRTARRSKGTQFVPFTFAAKE